MVMKPKLLLIMIILSISIPIEMKVIELTLNSKSDI
jgi:hypothetical protein